MEVFEKLLQLETRISIEYLPSHFSFCRNFHWTLIYIHSSVISIVHDNLNANVTKLYKKQNVYG